MRAIERMATIRQAPVDYIMAGREHARAELTRGTEQIHELDRAVAFDAGHRRLTRRIALGEAIDHGFLETRLVVEDVMRNAAALGHRTHVYDITPGAPSALPVHCRS